MAKIIIIGAGLSGLSTAYHLEKKGFTDYLIVEKDQHVGGLCRSFKQDGFTFDITGHLLHASDPYFSSFLESLVGDHVQNVHRNSCIFSHNMFTPYPYQINLSGLPTKTIVDCIEGFINRKSSIRQPKLFVDWVSKFFGQGFAKNFFVPYQRKLLQISPKKLSSSWVGRFVPQTSLRQLLVGALEQRDEKIGYNASFLYPRSGGINVMIEQLHKTINKPIVTRCGVTTIDLQNRVVCFDNGNIESFDIIVNTMPLDNLLKIINDTSSTNFTRAAQKLLCTSVACLNLGVSRLIGDKKHWIYYPEKQYPFYRAGFYHNFAKSNAPKDCSSLYVECAYRDKSERAVQTKLTAARKDIKKLFGLADKDIATEQILHIKHAYVIYDLWRDRNLQKLLDRLQQEGIYSIGRYGSWMYSSMQEAVLDGKRVAEKIVVLPARRATRVEKKNQKKVPTQEKSVTAREL